MVAFCLVILTILAFITTARTSHDWQKEANGDIFDRRTAVWCVHAADGRTACADLKTGKRTDAH